MAPATNSLPLWIEVAALLFLVILSGAIGVPFALRRLLVGRRASTRDKDSAKPSSGNPVVFMTASMQAVIQKLREQEKELERLHLVEKERAQESERMSEAVTRNMPSGLLLVNSTGTIGSANPAAEEILGIRGLQYRRYSDVLRPGSALAGMLGACLREGQTFQRDEIEYTTPEGETRQLGVTISPIFRTTRELSRQGLRQPTAASEAMVTGALCLMSDITELAALHRQMRLKDNLAALGEMSAGIAHEFKNALATISGYAQMIRSEAPSGDLAECAQRILEQTRSLTHIVAEFLRFARPLELSSEAVPLESLVERAAAEISESFPGVAVELEGNYQEVPGDADLLRQALLNLARNAAEAISVNRENGRVIITGSAEEKAGHTWQRITVADNGPGIPASDLDKIFLPFFTTKSSGTGLGLAVVQKIVLQHGGSIEAHNQPSGGAAFTLWLPLQQKPLPQQIASSSRSI